MMTDVLPAERQATLVITALMCSVTTIKSLATLSKTAPTKSLHWEYLATTTGCIHGHIMITTIETGYSPFTTDTAREDALTGHDHTTNPTTIEDLATTKDTSHPHPTTTAIHTLTFNSLSFD